MAPKNQQTKSKKSPKQKAKAVVKNPPIPGDTLPDVLGGPPEDVASNLLYNSRMYIDIYPCKTSLEKGISLMTMDQNGGWKGYVDELRKFGFEPNPRHTAQKGITVACQAENFPTDTFTNEYGEHFLNQITNSAGQGFGELAQMTGSKTGTEAFTKLGKFTEKLGKDQGGVVGTGIGAIGQGMQDFSEGAKNLKNKLAKQGGMAAGVSKMMDAMLAGARIDFPQIWKNSSYNATYSFTIKLYNPNPGSDKLTKQFIIGPLAAILCLALPQAFDESAYTWPFFCKVKCKGLFDIPMGAITNISVIKGGESGAVGFNQRVAMVDVRIDFVNLFNTLLLSKTGANKRPTLKGYLDNMMDAHKTENIYVKDDYKLPAWQTATTNPGDVSTTPNTATAVDPTAPPTSRVDTSKQSEENNLINRQPIID